MIKNAKIKAIHGKIGLAHPLFLSCCEGKWRRDVLLSILDTKLFN